MSEPEIIKIGDKEYYKLFDYTCKKCGKKINKNEWWDFDMMCEECMVKENSK